MVVWAVFKLSDKAIAGSPPKKASYGGVCIVPSGYRDYEPYSGRWTAKDPIFFAGGQGNLFEYTNSNPIRWRDPSGLNPYWDAIERYVAPILEELPALAEKYGDKLLDELSDQTNASKPGLPELLEKGLCPLKSPQQNIPIPPTFNNYNSGTKPQPPAFPTGWEPVG